MLVMIREILTSLGLLFQVLHTYALPCRPSPTHPFFPQTYGYPYLFALNNLESVGLLKKREKAWVGATDSGSPWPALRRALRLVNDAVDVHAPDDIAYVSSG